MSVHRHYIKKCKVCKKVMNQCRCIGQKTELWDLCDKCKTKNVEVVPKTLKLNIGSENGKT